MKIGIISDTHIKKSMDNFIDLLETHLKEVDLIIHAGDFISDGVVSFFNDKSFIGVWGNVDSQGIKTLLNEKEIFNVEGYRIGIFHGHGEGKSTIDRAFSKFKEDHVDIIIFGHSHQPLLQTKNRVLMLNPGSVTSKRKERWFTYIILELQENNISVQYKFFT